MSKINNTINTVVITGSSGLIGEELTKEFLNKGFRCIGIDISPGKEDKAEYHVLDLSSNNDLEQSRLSEIFKSIDEPFSLVHAAGKDFKLGEKKESNVDNYDLMEEPIEFINTVKDNLFMTYSIIFKSVKRMEKVNGGNIILLGSLYGNVAPNINLYKNEDESFFAMKPFSYSISKSTFPMFAKLIASRYSSRNIRCINLEPHAIIKNPSKEFKRNFERLSLNNEFGSLEELTRLIIMLASNKLHYLTGTSISIDGGWTSI